tara:strand:- start:51 stop:209 length:159 start_codon:yes stop_codon:yes gene_type:complete
MTYEGAAEFLEITVKHCKRLANAGRFPVTRLGYRTVRINRIDLEKYKAKCTK